MRYSIKIKDGFAEFEFGRVPLTEVILDVAEYGSVRADAALVYFLHSANKSSYGGCFDPDKCEVCKAEK